MVAEVEQEEAKPTHVTDRGGIVEVSVKAADGEVYTWFGTGSVEFVRTTQQDPRTKVMKPVAFVQAVLSLDPLVKQRALPVRPAPAQDENGG